MGGFSSELRPPIVTDADRAWALALCPFWCQRGKISDVLAEIVDDGAQLGDEPDRTWKPTRQGYERPLWDLFVTEQIERFEKFFEYDRKTHGEWSGLWRKKWFQSADPRKRFPRSAPAEAHPFFRAGSAEFDRALTVGTSAERTMWQRFGVAQFAAEDPRLASIVRG